ncbi:MAG: hypothetical protein O3C28_15960, partial [Proteobacteria bacterium]|nr:hypothetical protein [Pseudomonadota bacterium]
SHIFWLVFPPCSLRLPKSDRLLGSIDQAANFLSRRVKLFGQTGRHVVNYLALVSIDILRARVCEIGQTKMWGSAAPIEKTLIP